MTLRLAYFALIAAFIASFYGCESTCTYPDQQFFKLRLLNAMPDQDKITVFINGKLFKRDFTYAPPLDFGYTNTFEDGSPLPLGDKLNIVVTSDPAGLDTIHTGTISPNLHRQTLIIMGRGEELITSDAPTDRSLLLDDEDMVPDPEAVLIRLVHAIPDLPALDVFFNDSAVGRPDATIQYGTSTIRLKRKDFGGLTVTDSGDSSNIITSISTPFSLTGFFITTVIRGTSQPIEMEPVPAPIILSDNSQGNFILDFKIFGARFVNATSSTTLSLTATNPPPQNPIPRTNIPSQAKVLNIPPDSASQFFGVGVASLGSTRWFFSRDNALDTVFGTDHIAKANERWTFIAFENPDKTFNGVKLIDTMTAVPEAFGKMRVVNLSPDPGPVSVQISGGNTLSLNQGSFGFSTVSAGPRQITISSAAGTQTHTITIPPARPISIYILPAKPGEAYPVTISND